MVGVQFISKFGREFAVQSEIAKAEGEQFAF